MALRGLVAGVSHGDPFEDRPHSWAKGAIAAIFANAISRNREPADMAPISPRRYHGSTMPIQDFGFGSVATRVNRHDVIVASTRGITTGHNAVRRGRVV